MRRREVVALRPGDERHKSREQCQPGPEHASRVPSGLLGHETRTHANQCGGAARVGHTHTGEARSSSGVVSQSDCGAEAALNPGCLASPRDIYEKKGPDQPPRERDPGLCGVCIYHKREILVRLALACSTEKSNQTFGDGPGFTRPSRVTHPRRAESGSVLRRGAEPSTSPPRPIS